jgi:hypothetical protein
VANSVDEEGIAMDETRIYSVDSETFNELSHANDELIQYLQWLIERKEVDELTSDYQKRINEVVAETKRLENRVGSSEGAAFASCSRSTIETCLGN